MKTSVHITMNCRLFRKLKRESHCIFVQLLKHLDKCGKALATIRPVGAEDAVKTFLEGYRQLEKAYKEGKAKSIGISNFEGKYIEEFETKWDIVPQFIQVEAHPYFTQKEFRKNLHPLVYDINKAQSTALDQNNFFYCPNIVKTDYYGNVFE